MFRFVAQAVTTAQRVEAFQKCCRSNAAWSTETASSLYRWRLWLIEKFGQQAVEELHPLHAHTGAQGAPKARAKDVTLDEVAR